MKQPVSDTIQVFITSLFPLRLILAESCQTAYWKKSSLNDPSRRRRPPLWTTRRDGSCSPRKRLPTMITILTKGYVGSSGINVLLVTLWELCCYICLELPDCFPICYAEAKRSERIGRPREDQVRWDGAAGAQRPAGAHVCIPGKRFCQCTRLKEKVNDKPWTTMCTTSATLCSCWSKIMILSAAFHFGKGDTFSSISISLTAVLILKHGRIFLVFSQKPRRSLQEVTHRWLRNSECPSRQTKIIQSSDSW